MAALRSRVQTELVGIPVKDAAADVTVAEQVPAMASASIPDGAHCSVVFRGPLWMPTIDPTNKGTKPSRFHDDNTSRSSESTHEQDLSVFVLCTVQEIVQPYALVFTVEHPGTRYTDTRTFHLKDLEAILQSPAPPTQKFEANVEAVEAVDNWIESGELPRHDHLATWLGSQMILDLSGGGIRVAAIDGPLDSDVEDEQLSDSGEFKTDQLEFHDLPGADRESVASSWDGNSAGEDEVEDAMLQGGDEGMAPGNAGDWESGPSRSANNTTGRDANNMHYTEGDDEPENSTGARLPASDPFVLASLHAGAHLEELQKKDNMRKRVARVREEVIMQRARRLRAKTEFNRDITRLQHEEVGKAIMAQQVAVGVEAKLRQGDVMDQRKKRELRRITNPFKHNPADKWIKGPFLGEGPLPARVMDAPRRKARRDRERSKFVYDPHGRRILRKNMGAMRTGPPIEAAFTKLREAAMTSSAYLLDLRDLFDRFDKEKNGFLSRKEMLAAVHSLGVKLSEEEAMALADHFDTNRNGTVAFSEFSFGFFNRRSLISKWRMAKGPGMRSDASIMMMFRKYDMDASGRLEADEFARCLSEMGINLSELELQILAERFDEDKDGYIQPKEFLKFMKELVAEDAIAKKEQREKHANSILENIGAQQTLRRQVTGKTHARRR